MTVACKQLLQSANLIWRAPQAAKDPALLWSSYWVLYTIADTVLHFTDLLLLNHCMMRGVFNSVASALWTSYLLPAADKFHRVLYVESHKQHISAACQYHSLCKKLLLNNVHRGAAQGRALRKGDLLPLPLNIPSGMVQGARVPDDWIPTYSGQYHW